MLGAIEKNGNFGKIVKIALDICKLMAYNMDKGAVGAADVLKERLGCLLQPGRFFNFYAVCQWLTEGEGEGEDDLRLFLNGIHKNLFV